MAKRGVRYRISSEESETLSQGNTLRARLFRQAWQSEESRELLLSLIYGIQEGQLSAQRLRPASVLAGTLAEEARRQAAGQAAEPGGRGHLSGAGWLPTNFSDSLFRVLCTQMAGLLPGSTRDAAGLSILLVLLFRPYMVSEMSFVLPPCSAWRFCSIVHACVRVRSPCWSSSRSSYAFFMRSRSSRHCSFSR
ncbi:MAG: hypothetical protein ACLTCB_01065 [Merdibacter sp.]